MYEASFKFELGQKIDRENEIDQMVGKGLKLSTYLQLGFAMFEIVTI
jgi:hypothetical protein